MATEVPYTGVPGIVPRDIPTPTIGVNTPPAAFGVNVAEATQHLGQIAENSGQEIFDRAYAMQDLQVHADVNARLADMANKSMNLEADYSNLEGKSAVDGLTPFLNNLDSTRAQSGDGLSAIGQSYYDTESRNWRNRIAWNGVDHAKAEQKRYVIGTADANIEASTKMMEVDPNDPTTTEASLKQIRDQVAFKYGAIGGMSPQEVAQKQSDAVNTAVQRRIAAMAKTDSIGAQKLFDQAVKDGDIYGDETLRLSWYIKNQRDIVGSRTIAQQVVNGSRMQGGPVLRALFRNESGFRAGAENPVMTSSGHAQSYFQITTGTWREFAGQAGVDLSQYPEPLGTPYAIQAKVASIIPLRRWDSSTIAAMRAAGGKLDISKTLGENLAMNGEGLGEGITEKPSLEDLVARGRAAAAEQFPNDPGFGDIVADRIIQQQHTEEALRRDTDFHNDQTISAALFGGVGPQKKIPTSVEELSLDPNAKQAWDNMEAQHPSEMGKYLNIMARNARGNVAMTPERLNTWQTLSGEFYNNPEQFMKDTKDLSKVDLPFAELNQILKMQGQVYRKEQASPQMAHAMGIATPLLTSLGITKSDTPDKLNLFTGVMHDAMEQYSQQHGKPMSDDDIKSTAQRLLNPITNGGIMGWFGRTTPWFESIDQVPPEIADTIRQDFLARGITPDDTAILGAYLAAQYQELYGKTQAPTGGESYTPMPFKEHAPNIKAFQ